MLQQQSNFTFHTLISKQTKRKGCLTCSETLSACQFLQKPGGGWYNPPQFQSYMPITHTHIQQRHGNNSKSAWEGRILSVTMVTSCQLAYKLCLPRVCFDRFLLSAGRHLHYSFPMCESERQACIQPVVVSFPIHSLKQLNLKTAKALPLCFFRSCTLYGVILTEISTQASPSLPSLWIFHLRWGLI